MATTTVPELSSTLQNLLECTVCYEVCKIPIATCRNGHNVCQSHISQLTICPLCRVKYSKNVHRNFLAEKLIQEKAKKCKYSSSTEKCQFCTFNSSELDTHEKEECDFRPIRCPFGSKCDLPNPNIEFADFLEHLKEVHGVLTRTSPSSVPITKSFEFTWQKRMFDKAMNLIIMNGCGEQFLVTGLQDKGNVYFWVALHGTPETAKEFTTKIEFKTHADDETHVWNGQVLSTTEHTKNATNCLQSDGDSTKYLRVTDDKVFKKSHKSFKIIRQAWNLRITIEKTQLIAEPRPETSVRVNNQSHNMTFGRNIFNLDLEEDAALFID